MRLAGAEFSADALNEDGSMLLGEGIFSLLGRQIGIEILQLLRGDEGHMAVQKRRIAELGILAAHGQLRIIDAGNDARNSLMERECGTRFRRDDLFPIPLIDVYGMQVIQLFIAPDGVHIRIDALAGMDIIAIECHALPFGEGMDDLRLSICVGDIEANGTLDAVEVVIQTGGRLHEQRRRHAAKIQLAGERILKYALDEADGALRFVKRKMRRIARGDKRLTHGKSLFSLKYGVTSGCRPDPLLRFAAH